MVQPLHADLPAGTRPHGLFHIVPGDIGEQAVDPPHQLPLRLGLEVGLAVEGIAHHPGGVLHRDDTAGDHLPGEGVPLADLFQIGRDLVVQGGDGGRLPVGKARLGAVLVRAAEGRVLGSDVPPQLPAAPHRLSEELRGAVVAAQRGVLRAGAVCDEHQVVLSELPDLLPALPDPHQLLCHLSARGDVEDHVGDLRVILKLHIVLLQVVHHGQDQGLILVVLGKFQGREVGQAADMVDEPLEIQLHLQGRVPGLEGEHGPPVEPEVGAEELLGEHVGDGPVVQVLVPGEEKLHDLQGGLVAQSELPVCMGVLSPIHRGPAQGIVGVLLVQPVVFVQNRILRVLQGWDGAKQVPQALEVILHLPAAPDHEAPGGVLDAVAGPAGEL